VKVLQFPTPSFERRRPENRLKRSMLEAEQFEDRTIDYWLYLADIALDNRREEKEERKAA
jgi:hypothetical protein